MKRLLLPILIAFCSASGNLVMAQPTLTAATNNLQVGDQFQAHQATIGMSEFSAGALTGANQTWDFSTLASVGLQPVEVLARAAAPKPTNYPAANMVVRIGNEYAYFENNGTVIKEHAAYESTQNLSIENTDPAEKMRFPITYNDTYSDAFTGVATLGTTVIPRSGTVTVTAEGYGKLITPGGTFQNVLKVLTLEDANAGTMYSDRTITYEWFQAGVHFPVLRMSQRITLLGTIYSGVYLNTTALGVKKDLAAQMNLQLFPNPAAGLTTIQFELQKAAITNLKVTSLLGQEMMRISLPATSTWLQTQVIDVSGYAKGIYLVELETEGKVAVKKLVVQ